MEGLDRLLGCSGSWALHALCSLLVCGGMVVGDLRFARVINPFFKMMD
jgi:hypothetical protein